MPVARITYTIKDAKNALSQMQIHVIFNDVIEDASDSPYEFSVSYALYLDALITGEITAINVSTSVALPGGLKTTPTETSDVENSALFVWECVNGAIVQQSIPTFDEDLILADGNVDVGFFAPDDLLDWISLTIDTVNTPIEGNWHLDVSSVRGEDITNIRSANEKFTRSRRRVTK
jgi:hypothetical protein